MPIPLLIAAGVGAYGLVKGNQGRHRFQEAKEVQERAQERYARAEKALEARRQETSNELERLGRVKVDIYDIELREFVAAFRQIKNAELSDFVDADEPVFEAVADLDIASIDFMAIDAAKTAIAAGGAGAAAGAAAVSFAVTFGAASTGTAIATLGGAAATNATLAWFGGGALAAGGAGVTGGMFVLGGIVAAPVLAVGGLVVKSKGDAALERAKADAAEAATASRQLDTAAVAARAIAARARTAQQVLERLREAFQPMVRSTKQLILEEVDYRKYDETTRQKLRLATTTAITLRNVIDTPLIDGNGELTTASEKALDAGRILIEQVEAVSA